MGQMGLPLSISYGFAQSVLLNWILEINCIRTVESYTREPCTSIVTHGQNDEDAFYFEWEVL